jgi:hypothetical protein
MHDKPRLTATVTLPKADRTTELHALGEPMRQRPRSGKPFNRLALAAAHMVADPFADNDPWLKAAPDWDRTLAYREYLWDLGLGLAEAMDTAQRGMGLDWPLALELITRLTALARSKPGAVIFSGAGTDHLDPTEARSIDDVIKAYEMQFEAIEAVGGRIIFMASRALARVAKGPDDYVKVYDRILSQAREPVIIHWLGDMFDPALSGYWGTRDLNVAMDVAVGVINANATKVDGVKVSLLDKDKEIAMRRRLDESVLMYTGDDFNYAELIAGDEQGHSHALLGIFDAIAPAAATALGALTDGDLDGFHSAFGPTVPLSRHIFQAPTRFYKTGIVLIAYLNGHQEHFTMLGGQESARSMLHLAELFRLADKAGLFHDPHEAAARMARVMATYGIGA